MGTNKIFESPKYEGVRYKNLSDGNVSFYVRYTTKDGKRIQKKVGTKYEGWSEKQAFNKKIELEHNLAEAKPMKFKEVADRFLEVKKPHLKKKSFSTIYGVRKHLECLDDKNIESITQKDLNDIIIAFKDTMANNTLNRIIENAKSILQFAHNEYGITIQNFSNVKKLKIDDRRERFLSKEEILLLKKTLKKFPEHLLFVNLALCTGARLMSVLDIRKKDIDLENKTIALRDFKNASTYQGYLNDEVKNLLLQKWENLGDNDKVVQRSKNTIIEQLRDVLNRLFNKDVTTTKQKIVIHSLRHTFASHLAIQGTPIQIIQKLLNHKDIQMTMRYAHLMPDSGKEWVERIWG